jgi:hypothetical protein
MKLEKPLGGRVALTNESELVSPECGLLEERVAM